VQVIDVILKNISIQPEWAPQACGPVLCTCWTVHCYATDFANGPKGRGWYNRGPNVLYWGPRICTL